MMLKHMTHRAWALACVAMGGGLGACASAPKDPQTPEATVVAFARALNEGNLHAAYAMMSDDYRRRVSFEDWQKLLEENSQEVIEVSNSLAHARGPARIQASLDYQAKNDLQLVRQGERWSIESDVARFYDQSTPRAALHAFVRALERKRYDVVLRLVPNADKEGMTASTLEETWGGRERDAIERIISNLKPHLEDPIEVTGNRATLPYAERARVQFLKEDSLWKIEDPE